MTYRILITNDDGIGSSGLLAAYESVKGLGDVTIVAPATQQSAVGRSMTLFNPLRLTRLKINGTTAYTVSGTPHGRGHHRHVRGHEEKARPRHLRL